MEAISVDTEIAARFLRQSHGIESRSMHRLGSEYASTFEVDSDVGHIAVKMQRTNEQEFQMQLWRANVAVALRNRHHPIPHVHPALTGRTVGTASDGVEEVAITVSDWVTARPYGESSTSPAFPHALGRTAGLMHVDLAQQPHPPYEVSHSWAAHRVHDEIALHVPQIEDPQILAIASSALQLFTERIAPVARKLPRALVHQDLHDSNVLVNAQGELSAIIDFDDMLVTWTIAEPAVAAAYASRRSADPLSIVSQVLEGWNSVIPVNEPERRVFLPLVATRLALNSVIWHVRRASDRQEYATMRSHGSEAAFHAILNGIQ